MKNQIIGWSVVLFAVTFCTSDKDFQVPATSDLRLLETQPLRRLAFGSCNDLNKDSAQAFWDNIKSQDPEAWLWLGDIVYADKSREFEIQRNRYRSSNPATRQTAVNEMEALRTAEYEKLAQNNHYGEFILDRFIMGIWDDHDYGFNDADSSYEGKNQSKWALSQFLKLTSDHPVQTREGMYQSVIFGPPGQQVHLILLDLRTFSLSNGEKLLGEAQWQWLRNQLLNSPGELVVLGSSLPVLYSLPLKATWSNRFSKAYERLMELIEEMQTPVLFLSGDSHFASFVELEDNRLFEFTSSGLTHVRDTGEIAVQNVLNSIVGNENYEKILEKNYGLVEFDWEASEFQVHLQALSPDDNRELGRRTWVVPRLREVITKEPKRLK